MSYKAMESSNKGNEMSATIILLVGAWGKSWELRHYQLASTSDEWKQVGQQRIFYLKRLT